MRIQNIASYKFIVLTGIEALCDDFLSTCNDLALKGTVILSSEGINLSLAGSEDSISAFKLFLKNNASFADMTFRESFSSYQPFKRMKVKMKKEIITLKKDEVQPTQGRAPSLSPKEFKKWLDENRDMVVLDTRNNYEMEFGTFNNAVNLKLEDFSEFPEKASQLSKQKPIVMFCTGGVRCEKAAVHLLQNGYKDVYQLEGGILNYFKEVGGAHYQGDCFVFDERVAVNPELNEKRK